MQAFWLGRRTRQDDREWSFGKSLDGLRPRAEGTVRRMGIDATTAEDIVQDSVVKAWDKRESFEHGRDVWPWFRTIVAHTAVDHIRRRQGVRGELALSDLAIVGCDEVLDPSDRWADPEDGVESVSFLLTAIELRRHMQCLTREEQTVLWLLHEGASYTELEEVLGKRVFPEQVKRMRRKVVDSIEREMCREGSNG